MLSLVKVQEYIIVGYAEFLSQVFSPSRKKFEHTFAHRFEFKNISAQNVAFIVMHESIYMFKKVSHAISPNL